MSLERDRKAPLLGTRLVRTQRRRISQSDRVENTVQRPLSTTHSAGTEVDSEEADHIVGRHRRERGRHYLNE